MVITFLLSQILAKCDYTLMQGYLICSSCLQAVNASCGPFSVRAGGRGCQFCRDALGASLPPHAHWSGAELAALHVSYTFMGCHRHLQGSGSLSGTQAYKTEQGFKLYHMHSCTCSCHKKQKEDERSGMHLVETTLSVTQTQTLQEQNHHSELILHLIQNKSTNRENSLHSCIYCS